MLLAFSIFLFTGCASHRVISTSTSDSVRVEVIERVVEIYDTVEVEIPLIKEVAKIRQDSSSLANDYAKSEAKILPDGLLYHSLETIPQTIYAPIISSHTIKDSMVFQSQIISNVVEVERELTTWQKWRLNGFWVLLVIIAAYIVIKIYL